MAFDAPAAKALFDALESHLLTLGLFDRVAMHEPKNAPGNGLTAALWVQDIKPSKTTGLAETDGVVTFNVRIYKPMLASPQNQIDPDILAAAAALLGEYSGNFTLAGSVLAIDLLGMNGAPLSAQAGYLNQDSKVFRVMVVTVPVIIEDVWGQAA
jgi:hypothetical protein